MWRFVKFPKIVALLAFFLPWMTVSCSHQELASGTGWQLVTGHLTLSDTVGEQIGRHASLNVWLGIAVVAIIAGLVVACLRLPRPLFTLSTSLGALVLLLIGTYQYSDQAIARAAARQSVDRFGMDTGLLASLRVDWHWGYWLALAALAVATLLSWLALTGRTIDLPRDRDGGDRR